MAKKIGFYLHIPFCLRKCPYCDFYSVCTDGQQREQYVKSLLIQIARLGARHPHEIDTIYFGGGTPSLLSAEQIHRLLDTIKSAFTVSKDCEISMEANPGTVTPGYLAALRGVGINRLSFGVQSFADDELAVLGRLHTAAQAIRAVQDAAQAGFENLSVDLMLGIPLQTSDSLQQTLRRALSLPICHISAYMLKIEPDTPFHRQQDSLELIDDDALAELYLMTASVLKEHGFAQYEISNFSHAGRQCRHNLIYWRGEEYLAVGPGAHFYIDGQRGCYPRPQGGMSAYLEESECGEIQSEWLDSGGDFDEYCMLRLRLNEGLDLERTAVLYGAQRAAGLVERAAALQQGGFVLFNTRRLVLTVKGFAVSNAVIARLLYV